jgi:serine/threonine protein kinase/tetratricopeptide (TPR) repeat protein
MQERDLFIDALQKDDPAEREAFLAVACQQNAALRQRVDDLLAAHERQESFILDGPPRGLVDSPTSILVAHQPLGSQIGPYTLLQVIGEGGMGIVYLAEQKEPVARRVALKIIKPGLDNRQVTARFEAERQALAQMDHQNIAKVLEAGTTSSGQPYFVMELVSGIPLTKYCDEKQLSVNQRLALMIPVCQAIQHAHQKGIIHRDIKPSNVLVAECDGHAIPKVIDFGVAKAIAREVAERTMFTELGQLVGTLEYMSPEQAEPNQLDIDTRSDVYSLGVLLYELLTGSTPFDKQQLRRAAFLEMLRIIREDEPPKPSTKLSTADTLPSIAANRKTEPARLSRTICGDLDWIVMKSLEKDRTRRYETATAFAADLQRYLNDEAVEARPPSAGYRFIKFARRHQVMLTTITLVALALVTGTAISTWQAIRATRAETLAKDHEARAIRGEQAEALERRRAEDQARLLEKQRLILENTSLAHSLVTEQILTVMKDVPMPADKRKALLVTVMGHLAELDPAVRVEALRAAGQQFSTLHDLPSAVAAFSEGLVLNPHHSGLHLSRAGIYFRQQEYEKALQDLTDAITYRPVDHPLDLNILHARRAFAHSQLKQWDQALADLNTSYAESPKPTLDFLTKGFSGQHELMKAPYSHPLHAGVNQLFHRYVEDQQNSEEACNFAGNSLASLKDYTSAQKYFEDLVGKGPDKFLHRYSLALVFLARGDQAGYRRVCADMLAKSKSLHDEDFAEFVAYTSSIGPNAFDDYSPVIDLVRRGLAKRPDSSRYQFSLGALLLRSGQHEEARQRLHEALISNSDHQVPQTFVRFFVSMADYHAGHVADAKRSLHQTLQIPTRILNWRFDVILNRLRTEAIELIDPSAEIPAPTSSAPTVP